MKVYEALVIVVLVGSSGCRAPNQACGISIETIDCASRIVCSIRAGRSSDARLLVERARQGTPDDRFGLACVITTVLYKDSPEIEMAEGGIPVLLEIMKYPDDVVCAEDGRRVCPADICVQWFQGRTCLWLGSRGDPKVPRVTPVAISTDYWFHYKWPSENEKDRKDFLWVCKMCRDWYEARRGKLGYVSYRIGGYGFYYGKGYDTFVDTPMMSTGLEKSP